MQLLAINIFNKLCSLNLYNESGQRKSPNIEVGEEILQAVQYPLLAHKYLARNNKKTEWNKSCNVQHNVSVGRTVPKPCQLCQRIFKSELNFTLHVYWHAYRQDNRGTMNEDADDPSEEDISSDKEEENSEVSYRFVASPGWI